VGKFVFIMIGAAIWSFSHTLKIAADSQRFMIIFDNLAYLGMDLIALGVLTFTISFTKNKDRLDNWVIGLLLVEPVLNQIMIWSDPLHGFFRENLRSIPLDGYNTILYENGVWATTTLAYFYTIVLFSLLFLANFYLQSNQLTRTQTAVIILGISFPFIAGIVSMLGLIQSLERDIFPLTFGISNIFLAWGVLRFRIFDVVPISRERIIEGMHEGMLLIDDRNRILDVNPAVLDITGLLEKDLLGTPLSNLLPESEITLLSKSETIQIESQIKNRKSGSLNTYEVRISPLYDRQNTRLGRLIFLQDITRRKVLENELHRMATTDPLTGLLNRRQFEMLAKRELSRTQRNKHPLSVLMLDIDDFKKINDSYGHAAGDNVLKEFARRCRDSLRAADLFARFGGEEFVILLPETDESTAEQVAARLCACISDEHYDTDKGKIMVSACIGVTISQDGHELIEDLVASADEAMYTAKAKGSNTIALVS